MPVSAFMDRAHLGQGRMSLNFIDFLVGPIYKKLVTLLPELQFTVDNLNENRTRWLLILENEQQAASEN